MAIPFLSNVDFNQNEAKNLKLHINSGDITSPSPVDGQIFFDSADNRVKIYHTNAFHSIAGDITGISITAGAGLTGTVSTTLGSHTQTIDVVGGDGITANADEIEVAVDDTTIELSATNGSGIVQAKTAAVVDGGTALATGDQIYDFVIGQNYSTTTGTVTSVAISGTDGIDVDSGSPITSSGTITLGLSNVPNTSLANSSITIGDSTISLGGTDTTLTGLTDIDLTAGAKTIFDGVGAANLTIGAATTTVVIPGDLQVTGTVTTNNVETVSTSNGVVFEGNAADESELTLLAGTLTADRTITLPDATGTVALTSDLPTVNDATLTVQGNNGLTGTGTFTANDADATTITLSHADTSSQASVNNSGRTYIQDITLDTYGHITGITSATETVTDTNTQLATAAALIDVSAMAGNSTASFTHGLASQNLIVQMYDTNDGQVVHADIDHTSTSAISILFSRTGTQMVADGIGDIRVVVIDAKHGLSDETVTYS